MMVLVVVCEVVVTTVTLDALVEVPVVSVWLDPPPPVSLDRFDDEPPELVSCPDELFTMPCASSCPGIVASSVIIPPSRSAPQSAAHGTWLMLSSPMTSAQDMTTATSAAAASVTMDAWRPPSRAFRILSV
jgi:hypothetical protein